MSEATVSRTNYFLDGNFAPVPEEREAQDMEVIGTIPEDLKGHFLRVGPNPVHIFSEEAYHTFDGDGMIHAIEFSAGSIRYRNRFVWNEGFRLEQEKGDWIYKGMNSMLDPSPSRVPTAITVDYKTMHLGCLRLAVGPGRSRRERTRWRRRH